MAMQVINCQDVPNNSLLGIDSEINIIAKSKGMKIANLGPVHTSAFSNVCVFVRPKTHRSIRVHTTVFVAYSTVHTKTLENADPIVV